MNQFLIALCGIPASGKTTLAKQIIHHHPSPSTVELVSTDTWRDAAFYAHFTPEKENQVRKKALEKTLELAKMQHSVVHDDTNYYASMRHEIRDIALEYDCIYGTVFLNTPLKIALQWNQTRKPVIPEYVIERIDERLDAPGEKYAWDNPLATIDLSSTSATEGAVRILKAIKEMEAEEEPQHITDEENNRIDVVTRRIVSEFLENNPDMRPEGRVHETRKRILQQALADEWGLKTTENRLKKELDRLQSE